MDPGDLESVARAVFDAFGDRSLIGGIDVATWSPETIREGYQGLVRDIPSVESDAGSLAMPITELLARPPGACGEKVA